MKSARAEGKKSAAILPPIFLWNPLLENPADVFAFQGECDLVAVMGQGKTAGAGGQKVREGKVRLGTVGDEPDLRNALGLQLPQAPGGATEGGGVCLDGDGQNAVLDLGVVGKGMSVSAADPIGILPGFRSRLGGVAGELAALGRPGVGCVAAFTLCGLRAVLGAGGIIVVYVSFEIMIQRRDGFRFGVGWILCTGVGPYPWGGTGGRSGHLTSVPEMIALLAFDGFVRCVRIDILTGLVYLDGSLYCQIRGIGGDFISLRRRGAAVADSGTFVPVSTCRAALYLHLRVTGNRDIAAGTANSAADTGTAGVALGRNLAALDGNALAAAFVAAADTGTSTGTSGGYLAVGDGNVTAAASLTAADTGTADAALGRNLAAGYGNVTAAAKGSAADTGAAADAAGFYLAALDGNVTAAAVFTAADTCPKGAADGFYLAAGNCNFAGIVVAAVTAAADTGTVFAASGDNSSAGDGDIIAVTTTRIAADARTAFTAGGIQAAGAALWGGNGQIPGIFLVCIPA